MANQTSPMTALSNDNDFTNAIMVSTDEKAVYFQPTPVLVDPDTGVISGTPGIATTVVTATGAASGPVIANGRCVQVTFTGVSIAAAATLALTISNSSIVGALTIAAVDFYGVTTGSALSIQSIVNTTGQSVITIANGTGATTSIANIIVQYTILN